MKRLYYLLLLIAATMQVSASGEFGTAKTDAMGLRLIAYNDEYYNPVTGWYDYDSSSYTYSGTGTYSQDMVLRLYDTITDTYSNYSRLIYFYENFKWVGSLGFTLNGSAWDSSSRETYTYNADGQQAETLYEMYSGGSWNVFSRLTFTYDQGKLTDRTRQYFTGGVWENTSREVHTYNGQGQRTQTISQNWNSNAWEDQGRNTYQYDGAGNQIYNDYSNWSGGNWVPQSRNNLTFTPTGKITTSLHEQYNAGAWTNYSRSTYVYYTSADEDSLLLSEYWTAGAWDTSSKVISTWLNSTTKLVAGYGWNGTDWDTNGRTFYYYELAEISGLADVGDAVKVSAYPNPASGAVTLQLNATKEEDAVVRVFSLSGMEVMQMQGRVTSGENRFTLDTGNLSDGMYIYSLQTGSGKQTGKLLIQR